MNKKKFLIIAAIVLSALFVVGAVAFYVISYLAVFLKDDPLPEGFQKKHYSYEQVLDYAKSLDPNATVTDSYEEMPSTYKSYREWPAVINGVECHIASFPEEFMAKKSSSFMQTGYALQSDYDYIILCEIMEDYPGLGSLKKTRKYGFSRDMQGAYPSRLEIVADLDSIDEETFDDMWESYTDVCEKMISRGATRGLQLTIHLPDNVKVFILDADDENYQAAKEKLFG